MNLNERVLISKCWSIIFFCVCLGLSSETNVVTPNTESSWDFTSKTDATSLDLEWEDEEGESLHWTFLRSVIIYYTNYARVKSKHASLSWALNATS